MNKLLQRLISDQKNIDPKYKPGPFWEKWSKLAVKELEENGLTEFRSSILSTNNSGTLYSDATAVDGRKLVDMTSIKNKLGLIILNHTPLKKLFEFQVNLTKGYLTRVIELEKNVIEFLKKDRLTELIENYKIDNSINFGCDRISVFRNNQYSTHYLNSLDILDFVEGKNSLKECKTFLEIGPGFGANIHLIEQNYSKIRKYIAIDIVPNVWVLTEYLRSLYGDAVKDYLQTSEMNEIKFKDDDSLEIFVIPTWQIEKISSHIDCFWNAHSFVEMPSDVVLNYANQMKKISKKNSTYVFISYDQQDLKATFDSDKIPSYFIDVKFQKLKHPWLHYVERQNYFYLGKLS
jgi:putative sugar O-methyltransferase|tara:strand:+ start:126 stop:1169 length:1044 start_codon:yes stop_codon:yes gene_type:complete